MLGVAFTAGTLVLTDTMSSTFDDLSAGVYKGTDAVVRAKAVFNGPKSHGRTAADVDASLVPALSHVPGVAAAEGSVLRVRAADRQGRQGARQPGERRAHPGRQLEHQSRR